MKRKSYNPFEMVGSWIGAELSMFILILGNVLFIMPFFRFNDFILQKIDNIFGVGIVVLFYVVFGFLIGWIIHSFVRYLNSVFSPNTTGDKDV